MIVPSIDLQQGHAVQLVGGRERAIDAGDPRPITERFGRVGEVAVIDLDAATGDGANRETVEALLGRARCRVGGGVRSVDAAIRWLDAGAERVILGTMATPEILSELPRERTIAAVDADHGEVVDAGWRRRTGESLEDRLDRLAPHVGGFLVTFVEREGRLGGIDLARAAALRERVPAAVDLTVAGGVRTAEEIAALDRLGIDAQVGMAIYRGDLALVDAFLAPVTSDRPDGLIATVVADEAGRALGLAWSDRESVAAAIERGRGVYHSRRRGLWEKGATSGAGQDLHRIDVDCDRDCLRFTVRQDGAGFCHRETATCWGAFDGLGAVERTVRGRVKRAPAGSYVRRLLDDPALLRAKLVEEAQELAAAADGEGDDRVAAEAADVLFFALVAMAGRGVTLADVAGELDRRARKVTRRPGNAKPGIPPTSANDDTDSTPDRETAR